MSSTDGDAASRLDSALADLFSGEPTLPDRDAEPTVESTTVPATTVPATTDDDWSVDDPDDEPGRYTLPEIVPATNHPPIDDEAAAAAPVAATAAPAPAPPAASPAAAPPAAAPSATTPSATSAPATAWEDHMTTVPGPAPSASLRAPGRRPRVRRVTRVLRHIDPWSTFKVALLFSVVAYLVALTSGVLLWRVADSTGTLDNVERWFTQFGWETFELKGGEIFHNAWIIGLFGAVALTGGLVLLATLFNLVSDIVGGIRLTVLEEEVVERTVSSTRRYVVRRPPTAPGAQEWDVDDDLSADSPDGGDDLPTTGDDWSVDDESDDDGGDDAGTDDEVHGSDPDREAAADPG